MIKQLFVSGFLMLLAFPAIGQSENATVRLNVLSFNIRYNNPDDGDYAWPNRKEQVASVVEFHQADIVGMQEVLAGQLADLEQLLPNYGWIGVGRDDGKADGEFSPIFYRQDKFSVIDSGTFWLSENPAEIGTRSWDAALPRIATWARFREKETGKEFLQLNTHFDHRGEIARIESSKLIAEQLPMLGELLPWVVTGDFNKPPGSEVYTTMTQALVDSKFAATVSHGPEGTFGGFTVEEGETSDRIDYVFLSEGIQVHRYGALSDQWNGRYPSDHLPVLADIEF